MVCKYILPDIWFANIFSHSIWLPFHSVVSFALQKVFNLVWFYLFIFASIDCDFGIIFMNSLPKRMYEVFALVFF